MTTRTIRNEFDLRQAIELLRARKRPFTLTITAGMVRTKEQNRLQRLWCNEIAEQLGDRTAENVRGETKLRCGVPILRAESDRFCEKYDRLIRPRPYEEKVELMMEPMDFPVTRLMNTDQKTRFLDAMHAHWSAQGVVLTQPEREAA